MDTRAGAGAYGPRLVGRLTAELILRSPQYMNCVNYYEIDLRGNKISAIENLGATENQFDSIDLSDNGIVKLEGFPKLPRLKFLLLSNNRISKIARQLEESIPNVDTLVMSNNKIANLQDLDPLTTFSKLKLLSLLENPVTKVPNYRLYVIHRVSGLKVLDFKKVKQKERAAAAKLFGVGAEEGAAADVGKTFEPGEGLAPEQAAALAAGAPAANGANGGGADAMEEGAEGEAEEEGGAKAGPTPAQLTAIKAAIANAQTLEEVRRLEEALTGGHMPSEFEFGGSAPEVAAGNGAAAGNGDAQPMEEGAASRGVQCYRCCFLRFGQSP